jgi:hypothetical protein
MAQVTELKALTNYFNVAPRKLPAKEWMTELKMLTPEAKRELAELVVIETGDTLAPLKMA